MPSNRSITIKSLLLNLRLGGDGVRHNVTSTWSGSDLNMVVLCTLEIEMPHQLHVKLWTMAKQLNNAPSAKTLGRGWVGYWGRAVGEIKGSI